MGLVLGGALGLPLAAQDVVISEIQANNRGVIEDRDGDPSDWIEVLNADVVAVDIDGWGLTDDPLVPFKWTAPSVTIPAGGFLIVFASGKHRTDPTRELHTNFELDSAGEYVALVRPDGSPATELHFPEQVENFSYGLSMNGTFENLVAENTQTKVFIPANGNLGLSWTQVGFDDASWAGSTTGVGYDRNNDYQAFINTDVSATMQNVNTTAYIRVPFNVDDRDAVGTLAFSMQYDDGFVAYINGERVASRNAPASPSWDSTASGQNDDSRAVRFEEVALDEISPAGLSGLLQTGPNVLAIHGLNANLGSSDFLIQPKLDGVGVGELDREEILFFPTATPGAPNLQGYSGVASKPTFSVPSMVFTGNLSVLIRKDDPGGVIRYTTNGSEPTQNSTLYSGPISVTTSTLVRAKVFVDGLAASPTVSAGYVGLTSDTLSFTSDLPVILIENFGRGRPPSDPYQSAFMAIFEPQDGVTSFHNEPQLQTRIGIKRRGASTGGREKASYTLEAWDEYDEDKEIRPFNMPEESDWILYGALNFDRAHIRNAFIYELSNQIGRYAVRTRFCEVLFNEGGGSVSRSGGDYRGIYTFMEKIKRDPERVDVEKLTADHVTLPEVAGGYLVKIDRLDPGDSGFGAGGRTLGHVYPKEDRIAPEQLGYIRDYINTMVSSLTNRDPVTGYRRYLDPISWVDHHILNVLSKNADALRLSTYMFKGRDGRYEYGPIWDFDRSMESTDGRDDTPTGWDGGTNYFTYPWWDRLFQDPDFWQDWIDRWTIHRRGPLSTENMSFLIDSMANEIRQAQPRDLQRWGQTPRFGSFQGEVDHLKNWLATRANWMDSRFVAPPRLSSPGRTIDPGFQLSISASAGGTIFYTLDGSDPRSPGGGIASFGIRYTGPLTLEENARVFARVRGTRIDGSDWSGPADETFVVETPRIVVSEIMYHPPPPHVPTEFGSEEFEFIELMNASGHSIELAGAGFTAGISFKFADDEPPLSPGELVVLVRNIDAFSERYDPGGIRIAGEYRGRLASEGETLEFVGPLREPILRFEYDDLWYPSTDGQGESLNIVDPYDLLSSWREMESWSPSSVLGGTPGEVDPGLSNLGGRQRPGDSNQDGIVDVSDSISILRLLFLDGGQPPVCEGPNDEGGNLVILDLNGDEAVDISDVLHLLSYLFRGGPAPAGGSDCIRVEGCPNTCLF